MGSVKIDICKEDRRLDDRFPIDSVDGVLALLDNLHHVRELRFARGDYAASNLLIDFFRALYEAKLTRKQLEVLWLLYEKDLTQHEVGLILGISQQAVLDRRNNAIAAIVTVIKAKEEADDAA